MFSSYFNLLIGEKRHAWKKYIASPTLFYELCHLYIYIEFIFCKIYYVVSLFETLKYRQLVLDENTRIQRYQTKIHEGVVPSNLTKYGKCITVNDGLTYILDKESNKKKLNTPVKENFCKNLFQTPKSNQNEGNDYENDEIQTIILCKGLSFIPQ
jgi:hypothetical protein